MFEKLPASLAEIECPLVEVSGDTFLWLHLLPILELCQVFQSAKHFSSKRWLWLELIEHVIALWSLRMYFLKLGPHGALFRYYIIGIYWLIAKRKTEMGLLFLLIALDRLHHLLQHRRECRDTWLGHWTCCGKQTDSPDPRVNTWYTILLQNPGQELKRHGTHVWSCAVQNT